MNEILKINNLSKKIISKQVIDNINISIEKGKIVGLIGQNGSGKTTLMKMIVGLMTIDSGEILICGNAPSFKTKELISYLPDQVNYENWMKVIDIINMYENIFSDFDKNKAIELCNTFHIEKDLLIKTLSKGTKEKVAIILTMSRKAKLYILDEPMGGIDIVGRDMIIDTIIKDFNTESSVLISTHLIQEVEKILDEVIIIDKGKIILSDNIDNLRENEEMSLDTIFRNKINERGETNVK